MDGLEEKKEVHPYNSAIVGGILLIGSRAALPEVLDCFYVNDREGDDAGGAARWSVVHSPHAAHTRNLNFVPDKLLELRIACELFLRAITLVEEVLPTGSLQAPLSYYPVSFGAAGLRSVSL